MLGRVCHGGAFIHVYAPCVCSGIWGGVSSYHHAITASLIGGATERNMEGMSEHQEMSAAFLTEFLRKCDMVHQSDCHTRPFGLLLGVRGMVDEILVV